MAYVSPDHCSQPQRGQCSQPLLLLPRRGPIPGGPLVYVAGTFSKLTSLTEIFPLLRARTISSTILVRKVDAEVHLSNRQSAFRQNKGAGYIQCTMLDVPAYLRKVESFFSI